MFVTILFIIDSILDEDTRDVCIETDRSKSLEIGDASIPVETVAEGSNELDYG